MPEDGSKIINMLDKSIFDKSIANSKLEGGVHSMEF